MNSDSVKVSVYCDGL